jgi:Asp-tRNA(Asn)/Glu-tRNA(Gln) amidotransferase A subunit family amidase
MRAFADRLGGLEDAEVEEASLPAEVERAHEIQRVLYHRSLAYYFREEAKQRLRLSPIMREILEDGERISPEEYRAALEEQVRLQRAMERFFDRYDLLVSHAVAGEAPLRAETEKPDPALIWTLAHLPVVCAPAFVGPSGLPLGVQVVGRKYEDPKLFRACREWIAAEALPSGAHPIPPLQEDRGRRP